MNRVHVLQDAYAHCIDGRDDLISQQIEDALDLDCDTLYGSQCVTASVYTHRRYRPDPVRHMSVNDPGRPTDGPQSDRPGTPRPFSGEASAHDRFRSSEGALVGFVRRLRPSESGPRMADNQKRAVC